jgi:hypothetical protein
MVRVSTIERREEAWSTPLPAAGILSAALFLQG